jgi:hypothetical protein
MAHLNWHGAIIERWKHVNSNLRYHLTETGWLLSTTGPRLGSPKVICKPKHVAKRLEVLDRLRACVEKGQYVKETV